MALLVFGVDLPFVDELKLVVLSFLSGGLNRVYLTHRDMKDQEAVLVPEGCPSLLQR
jgi:hypothetical protein